MYSLDTTEDMRQEKIILTQKENIAKKRNKQKKKDVNEKWQKSCQISYKNMDNNSSSPIIDANFKLSSDDGMTPNNCLTLSF